VHGVVLGLAVGIVTTRRRCGVPPCPDPHDRGPRYCGNGNWDHERRSTWCTITHVGGRTQVVLLGRIKSAVLVPIEPSLYIRGEIAICVHSDGERVTASLVHRGGLCAVVGVG